MKARITFDEAWASHLGRRHIVPPDQEAFRHGWNSALEAVLSEIGGGLADASDVVRVIGGMSVEVKT